MKLDAYRAGARASEHSIQVQILSYLYYRATPGVFAVAIPNAGKRSGRMGARMKEEGLTPGAPDLCILLPEGKCAWMETKTAKGRQSDTQKGFQARCERIGHLYVIVRSLQEAQSFLLTIKAIRPRPL
jgi:hypothetical protein